MITPRRFDLNCFGILGISGGNHASWVAFGNPWHLPSLQLTLRHRKIGQNPIGNDRLPTIHFSGAMSCQFQGKANHQHSLVGGFKPIWKNFSQNGFILDFRGVSVNKKKSKPTTWRFTSSRLRCTPCHFVHSILHLFWGPAPWVGCHTEVMVGDCQPTTPPNVPP